MYLGVSSSISLRGLDIAPPRPMVAQKSPRTVYLIIDAKSVPNVLHVPAGGQDRGATLTDVQVFVERDLKKAIESYFAKVNTVPLAPSTLEKDAVYVDVKIDRFEMVPDAARIGLGHAELTWSLGLRAAGGLDYLYTFAAKSRGNSSDQSPEFVIRSAFENAILDFRSWANVWAMPVADACCWARHRRWCSTARS